MYVRVKKLQLRDHTCEYLQIVRCVRDGSRVKQHLVASLGRRDHLLASGQLDELLRSLARFSESLCVVETATEDQLREPPDERAAAE